MTDDKYLDMVHAMKVYGGGFVQALAECFLMADARNEKRLLAAFPEYVELYLELAKKEKANEQSRE